MTAAITSSFWANLSNPFARSFISAFLTILSPSWSLENGQEKCQKHHWEHHQQKHCIHLIVFSQKDFYSCLAQKSQSLIFVINRTARGKLQYFFPKMLLNVSKMLVEIWIVFRPFWIFSSLQRSITIHILHRFEW